MLTSDAPFAPALCGREEKPRITPMTAASFDWHAAPITRATPVTPSYRSTQNVRRFLLGECGDHFCFDRAFMEWIKDGTQKTMGDVADEWLRRHPERR